MGTTDYGSQRITFDFREPGQSEGFNRINYRLLPQGIYSDGLLTKINNTHVSISKLICYFNDNITKVGVRIETTAIVSKEVSPALPYIVLRFSWLNVIDNFMDVESVSFANLESTDIILGRCVYTGSTLGTTFDYARKVSPRLNEISDEYEELKVIATEPYSKTVIIQAGTLYTASGIVDVDEQISPEISNTTLGRIDLVWIDGSGDVQIEEGVDNASPTIPGYGLKMVVAEISRGAAAAYITGADITRIFPYNRSDAYATEYMKTVLDDESAGEALTTLGFSAFIKTLINDTDAIEARATLNSEKKITISTSDPSGGSDDDIWFVREA